MDSLKTFTSLCVRFTRCSKSTVTSAKEVMFLPLCVNPSVCLSVRRITYLDEFLEVWDVRLVVTDRWRFGSRCILGILFS